MSKPDYHVVSLSGGKDSTAMLLMMLEKKMQIDCVIFCDTGIEFPEMYTHLDRLEKDTGIKITRLKAEYSYEYYFLKYKVKRHKRAKFIEKFGRDYDGYGWAGPRMRWCTSRLKDMPREQFLRGLREKHNVIQYIGIAADEEYRLNRKNNQNSGHVHPLVDWGVTEKECLSYCYERGYDWGGLYKQFRRVSCWCCPLQSLAELRMLWKYHPNLWEQLKVWDKQTWRGFRADYNVEELECRFKFEEECIKQNIPINNKAFFKALKKRLEVIET